MFTYETQVVTSNTDMDGLQTVVSVLDMMQDCSTLWMDSEPQVGEWLEAENAAMLIACRQVDIYKRAPYREHIKVVTSIYDIKGPLGYRNTALYDESGEMLSVCWGIGPFVNRETGKMVKTPDSVKEQITIDPKVDMEYLPKKIKLPKVEAVAHDPIKVLKSDLDYNRHVNNVSYVRMAYEFVPDDFEVERIRIEYKNQCMPHSTMHPHVMDAIADEGRIVISLDDEDGEPYTIVEFSRR